MSMKEILIYDTYTLLVPEGELSEWDVYQKWEKPRFESMQQHLKPGDVMYDVGTEHGWLAALFQKYLGLKMVLIEPTPEFWPNIKTIWESNHLEIPHATYQGFAANKMRHMAGTFGFREWPDAAQGQILRYGMPYRYLHNPGNVATLASHRLDEFPKWVGVTPQAVNIDTEGSELTVLQGAKKLLHDYKPLVWVSIHPDLMEKDYGTKPKDVHDLMKNLGYKGELLEESHELHYFYRPI